MPGETYRLQRRIAVIELLQGSEETGPRLGELTFLGEGAQVEICGPGFNIRTVRICAGDCYYFAFEDEVTGGTPRTESAVSGGP